MGVDEFMEEWGSVRRIIAVALEHMEEAIMLVCTRSRGRDEQLGAASERAYVSVVTTIHALGMWTEPSEEGDVGASEAAFEEGRDINLEAVVTYAVKYALRRAVEESLRWPYETFVWWNIAFEEAL